MSLISNIIGQVKLPQTSLQLGQSAVADYMDELSVIMVALRNRADHYIFILWFLLLSSFFPRLISAVADWMCAILPHMVWPLCEFKMQV